MSEPAASPGFKRVVSRWQIVALSINDVVGSGVYLLPAAAAALLGPMSIAAVALAGMAVFLVVLCFAEAGTYFDEPGSGYLYAKTAFGELVGFQVGWLTILTRFTTVASLSAGFAQALTFVWPGFAAGWGRTLAIIAMLLFLTTLNIVGVAVGAGAATLLAILKLVPLAIFILIGGFSGSWSTLIANPTHGGSFAEAAFLLLFAYAGFENTAAAAGEFKRPERDVPFALLTQIGVVTFVYVSVQAVALLTLPDVGGAKTPLADAAALFLGPVGGVLLTVGAVFSILGTINNSVLSGPRYLFALAHDGFGPAALASIHPRFRTPWVAILTLTAISLPLALSGSFTHLAALSVVVRLFTYLGTAGAVPFLRKKLPRPEGAFRLPWGPTIPIAACVLAVLLGSRASTKNLLTAFAAILVGFLIFALRRKKQAQDGTSSP
jgi:basic amino acid/polyamine antiporter, APA family